MNANRLSAAAVLAVAALALTACGPDETAGAPAAAGSSAPTAASSGAAPSATAQPSATQPSAAKPSATPSSSARPTAAKPSATKPTGATPSPDCTAQAASVGQVVEATDNGYLTSVWMKAKPTKFVCGPDVPDDGYFTGYGSPAVYSFSNDVKTSLLAGVQEKSVDLDTFMKHMDTCLHSPSTVAAPYQCYGNQYVVKVSGQNVVTSISELYHP
ncbi:hypothetical protein GCM10009665_33840 [Kitasatospora nipponensis]|uniref:LppP/LprE lipoprotein n=1 Tax=Kitasatospora nipponensis TaxID=258049 RepID=A0ABN1W8L2_9ACTN